MGNGLLGTNLVGLPSTPQNRTSISNHAKTVFAFCSADTKLLHEW